MSTDLPAALANEAVVAGAGYQGTSAWTATALTVFFAAAMVLLASFLAVVTGLR